jgi:ketosteroid isomerase-like protein
MKHKALVLALLLAAAPVTYGHAQEKKPAPAKPADAGVEQTLMKIENDMLAALLKKDLATFGKHFAEEAVLTTPDGSVVTKAELLGDLKSGALVLESSSITDMKVKAHGDTAVVTYITTDKGKYKGQDISGRFRWTDVFVRRGGSWQLVAGHGTPIQAPPK